MRFLKKHFTREMIRPAVYMTFTRFLLSLCLALLLEHFLQTPGGIPVRMYACVFLGVFFAALAWIAYLRLDGVKLPKLMMKRVSIKKKPARTYGDMSDYTDQEPVSFEELEDSEKDVCILLADLFCCAVFLILSLF